MQEALIQKFPILELLQAPQDPPLTREAIEKLEELLEVRFPNDYVEFLLAFNGGYFPRRVDFSLPEPKRFLSGGRFTCFYGQPDDGIEPYGIIEYAKMLSDRLPEDVVAIADCNSQDLVVLRYTNDKTTFAGVWFWDSEAFWDDEPPLHWLADTFNDFLSMLIYDVTAFEGEPEELPLFQTIQNGSFRAIERYLAEGGDVEAGNAEGHTLLMAAILHCWPRIAKLLIEQRADVNARDHHGRTPLHHAATHSVDCVKLLLASGADAKARDYDGKSVLGDNWSYRADQILRAHGAEE